MSGGVDSRAVVDPSARIGDGCVLGPFCVVEADAEIGEGCVLEPFSRVCRGTALGREVRLGQGAVVGGLALMGATSLNVIERTREIGVMRAIGASGGTLLQIFMGEAVVVGVLSWLAGMLVAIPLSKFLGDAVGIAFMQTPLTWRFSLPGSSFWLLMVVLLAAVASFLPAWRATRVSVRESLAYE